MSDEFRVLDGEIDLERDDVRDSRGRRIDADYVDRAVADVHTRRGRRLLGDDPPITGHSPRVSFRVPEQTRRRAEERAHAEGRSVSEVAREALERYLANLTRDSAARRRVYGGTATAHPYRPARCRTEVRGMTRSRVRKAALTTGFGSLTVLALGR